jgi:hypothetical protein
MSAHLTAPLLLPHHVEGLCLSAIWSGRPPRPAVLPRSSSPACPMRSCRSAPPLPPRSRAAAVPLVCQRYTGRMSVFRCGCTLLRRARQASPQGAKTWRCAPAKRRNYVGSWLRPRSSFAHTLATALSRTCGGEFSNPVRYHHRRAVADPANRQIYNREVVSAYRPQGVQVLVAVGGIPVEVVVLCGQPLARRTGRTPISLCTRRVISSAP